MFAVINNEKQKRISEAIKRNAAQSLDTHPEDDFEGHA
jgi:hypothetical protein